MRALVNKTVSPCMWIAILCLWTWTARADEGGRTMRSGLVGRAGAVELLEFEKQHVVREVRIVKVTDAGTNVVATTTITGGWPPSLILCEPQAKGRRLYETTL